MALAVWGQLPRTERDETRPSLEESLAVSMYPDDSLLIVDCGELAIGESVERVLSVPNRHERPISISRIESFCGCANLDWTREEIEPGASGEVTLLLDAERFAPGRFEKHSVIHFRDRVAPAIPVVVRGSAVRSLALRPETLELRPLIGEEAVLSVAACTVGDQLSSVVAARSERGHFEVEVPTSQDPGATALQLRAVGREPRHWSDHLVLEVDDRAGKRRTIRVPVAIEHRNRIETLPGSRIIFGARDRDPESSEPPVRRVELRGARDDCRFRILEASLERQTGAFSVGVEDVRRPHLYALVVTLVRAPTEAVVRDRIIVKTDDLLCPTIEIDVVAACRAPLVGSNPTARGE